MPKLLFIGRKQLTIQLRSGKNITLVPNKEFEVNEDEMECVLSNFPCCKIKVKTNDEKIYYIYRSGGLGDIIVLNNILSNIPKYDFIIKTSPKYKDFIPDSKNIKYIYNHINYTNYEFDKYINMEKPVHQKGNDEYPSIYKFFIDELNMDIDESELKLTKLPVEKIELPKEYINNKNIVIQTHGSHHQNTLNPKLLKKIIKELLKKDYYICLVGSKELPFQIKNKRVLDLTGKTTIKQLNYIIHKSKKLFTTDTACFWLSVTQPIKIKVLLYQGGSNTIEKTNVIKQKRVKIIKNPLECECNYLNKSCNKCMDINEISEIIVKEL